MQTLNISNEKDRLEVAGILIKNGYTVWIQKEVIDGKKCNVVAYTKENHYGIKKL